MTEFTAITTETHAKKGWKNVPDYAFSAADNFIPLMGAELSKAIPSMPTGFIKQEAGYMLVGITSLQAGMNVYVAPDGKWLGTYIPAVLRAYPFRLAQQQVTDMDASQTESILCINEASGLVVESPEDGNAFYDDQNQPTQGIKDILNLLSDIENKLVVTQRAVNALEDAGIIIPWELHLQDGEEVVQVTSLFRVDEEALNKLNDDDFLALRKAQGLAIAHAQLLSMNQMTELGRLGQSQGQTANSEDTNLTGFNLSEENGLLTFD